MLQESSRVRLYLTGIFYLNFRQKLLILPEANFLHLMHRPPRFIAFL